MYYNIQYPIILAISILVVLGLYNNFFIILFLVDVERPSDFDYGYHQVRREMVTRWLEDELRAKNPPPTFEVGFFGDNAYQ